METIELLGYAQIARLCIRYCTAGEMVEMHNTCKNRQAQQPFLRFPGLAPRMAAIIVMSPDLWPLTRQQSDSDTGLRDRTSQRRYPRPFSYCTPVCGIRGRRVPSMYLCFQIFFFLQSIALAAAVERLFAIPASLLI